MTDTSASIALATSTRRAAAPDTPVRRRVDRTVAGLIIVMTVARIAYVIMADPVNLTFRSTDDAYYYFNVARHIVAGDGMTFDGINTTNGFHPLWMLMLLPVFAIISEPTAALRAVFVMVTGIAALNLWVAYRCVVHWAGRGAGLFGVCLLFAPFFLNAMVNGLETGLLILALFILIRAEQRWSLLSVDAPLPANVLLGVLLAFVFLSRLDGVFVVLAVMTAIAWIALPHRSGGSWGTVVGKLVSVGLPALVLVAPYLLFNMLRFGHLVPISGALKSSFPQVSFAGMRLSHLSTRLALMQIAMSTAAITICLLARRTTRRPDRVTDRVPAILWVLYGAGLLHLVNTLLFMNWAVHWWHFASYVPATIILTAMAFDAWVRRLGNGRVWTTTGVVLAAAASAAMLRADTVRRGDHHKPWYHAALWANAHLPPSAVLAMTDCGLFGYFCRRPTVNLDGVINGYEYQRALRDHRLRAYLKKCNVTHIADYEVHYGEGPYRIRLPARLYRRPGGLILATPQAETYHSDPYGNAFDRDDAIHFAIWPIDRLTIIDAEPAGGKSVLGEGT